jgi:uncharacterized membrane protein YgaE (UPF0421/DUF939 family)
MQVSSPGHLPSGVPKIKPDIGHFVPRDELSKAYKKINHKAERIVWKEHGIIKAEEFDKISDKEHRIISEEFQLKALELTEIFHEQLRKQLGI